MSALSVLVIILSFVNVIVGECISPTCSGDQATCASTAGCKWSSGGSGYCEAPSCGSANTEDTCTAKTNCAWRSTGTCSRPTSQECRALAEETCSAANSGCRWVAASSQCSGPTSKQCDTMSQTACQSEESGCRWSNGMVIGDRCENDYEKCYGLSPTACGDKSGCEWHPGNCTYTGCEGLAENACKADNNCYYSPPQGSCRAPQSSSCANLNPTACAITTGCHFTPDQTDCMPNSSGVTSCSSYWNENGQRVCGEGCTMKVSYAGACEADYVSCYNNADNTGCTASSLTNGCIWSPISQRGYCSLDYGCEDLLSESECYSNGRCQYTPPQGTCVDHPQKGSCSTLSLDDCSNTEYCQISEEDYSCSSSVPGVECQVVQLIGEDGPIRGLDGHICYGGTSCFLSEDGNSCSSNEPDVECNFWRGEDGQATCWGGTSCILSGVCSPIESTCRYIGFSSCSASRGCVWDGSEGKCHHWNVEGETPSESEDDSSGRQRRLGDPLNVCSNNAEITACAAGSPAGCTFSGGSCSSTYVSCEKSGNGKECSQASKDAGCVWRPGNEATAGYCYSMSRAQCYKNAAGTACDASSSLSSCTFQSSPGYCAIDYDIVCSVKADGSGCDTDSAASGCKWTGGKCYNALTCYKNSDGDGCDTTNGATGCTWQPATSGVCKQSGICTANSTNDGCSDDSLVAGCVWDNNGSAASMINIPIFLLLVLLLFNL